MAGIHPPLIAVAGVSDGRDMLANHRYPYPLLTRVYVTWLTWRVHLDALIMQPRAYLTAAKWWILGKRVRARGQFAPLLGNSPRAYRLRALHEDQRTGDTMAVAGASIAPLVLADHNAMALQTTLESLQRAGFGPAVIIGPDNHSLYEAAAEIDFTATRWIMPIRAGDRVARNAAAAYLEKIGQCDPACHLIYADDDLLDGARHRTSPHFKPDWNRELYRHHDYLTGACVLRTDAASIRELAGHAHWVPRLIMSAAAAGPVEHVRSVLHHRRARTDPRAKLAPVSIATDLPLVTVIIPTRNRADLLRTCITGLRATDYPALEIIIADNDSDEPETTAYLAELTQQGIVVLPQPGPFNYSTINNNAVAIAKGELICLMNNDIEVLTRDWLAIMASQAMRPEVGAVGAQLLYPDGRIQHAGVVIGVGNAAGHAHRFLRPEAEGYFRRHALPQYVSAVTAACLVVQKERFLVAGGLDETNFAVAFNDVDLCLRLNQHGWQSFYEPRAVLVHHESVSRAFDTDPVGAARFAGELAALQRIWRTNEIVDPFHHPNLSRASEQFAISLFS